MEIIINKTKDLEVPLNTIHLVRNPINGGNPPNESKFKNKMIRSLVGVI
jgi:hypothetical protein